MIVAIHQPNFFPWLGYFNKIAEADVFCLLDNVQFQKTGGTWTNRVRLAVGGEPAWVTVPVERAESGTRLVGEVRIDTASRWREKLLRTIRASYGRAPHFAELMPLLETLVSSPEHRLADFNVSAIRGLGEKLHLERTRLVPASTLAVRGQGTDLLIEIVHALGGSAYLCGGGAEGYQEDEKFERAGIRLVHQDFVHPEYPQGRTESFVPGLSVIDALMNCGFAETERLITER